MHHCSTDPHRLAGKGGAGGGSGGGEQGSLWQHGTLYATLHLSALSYTEEKLNHPFDSQHTDVWVFSVSVSVSPFVSTSWLLVSTSPSAKYLINQTDRTFIHSVIDLRAGGTYCTATYICIYVKFHIINQGFRVIDPWLKSIRIRPGCFFKPWPGACLLSLVYRIIFFLLRAVAHLKPIINSIYQQICGKTEMQRNEYFLF